MTDDIVLWLCALIAATVIVLGEEHTTPAPIATVRADCAVKEYISEKGELVLKIKCPGSGD